MELDENEYDILNDLVIEEAGILHILAEEIVSEETEDAVRGFNERMTIFSDDREAANRRVMRLLSTETHSDLLRVETRLTRRQFMSLATWLDEYTILTASKYATINTKLYIFIYICSHGVSFRNAAGRY